MQVTVSNLGKRFNRHWIFRNLSFEFKPGHPVAITGANGSGKSTLLQVIGGTMEKSEGQIHWLSQNGTEIPVEQQYKYVSYSSPTMELIEELNLMEFLAFHEQCKPWATGVSAMRIAEEMGLQKAADKQIRHFSSGMKQRVKLAQAIYSNTPALLLDEPTTNLDAEGVQLYLDLMKKYCTGRTVLIASNDEKETSFCTRQIEMESIKPM
jgi:ABC-type multidrug transport system ATPase subunit